MKMSDGVEMTWYLKDLYISFLQLSYMNLCGNLQLYNMWVSEEWKVLDLPPDLPDDIEVFDLLPIQNLDGNFVASHLMDPDFYFAESTDT